jgi:hypothetical protein
VIEHVESFHPELQTEPVRQTKVLKHRYTAFQYPGPKNVLRRLPTQPRLGAEKKFAGRLKPFAHWSWLAFT